MLTSCAVLVSLGGVWLGYPQLDAIGGLVIAVFIAHTGIQIGREASGILSDRVVMSEDDIRRVVMGVAEVKGCHHIRTRGSADHTFLDLHVWFPGDTSLHEAHRLSHVVKDRLMAQYPHIADAIIHIEPPPTEIQLVTGSGYRSVWMLRSRRSQAVGVSEPEPNPTWRAHSLSPTSAINPHRIQLLDLLTPALLDHLALHLERRRQLARLDRELGGQERDLLDALELGQVAVERVDDLLVERQHVGTAGELGARLPADGPDP